MPRRGRTCPLRSKRPLRRIPDPHQSSNVRPEDRLTLCTFASPSVARRLEALGAPLYNVRRGTASSWHAAVLNGPEFLSYINEHTTQRPTLRDLEGDTPLHVAICANRVDSVIWLSKYTDAQAFSWDSAYPETLEIACQLTSPESVRCLEIILPKYIHWMMDTFVASFYLRTIAEVTREDACAQAVRGDVDQIAYQEIRDRFEYRAIRKTETMEWFFEGCMDGSQRQTIRQTEENRLFRQAKLQAWFGGFERLAWAMKKVLYN